MNARTSCFSFESANIAGRAAAAPRRGRPRRSCRGDNAGALAVVAHDLRGPLANLSLLIEAIDAGSASMSAERRGVLTGRAARLVERLERLLTSLIHRARSWGDPLAVIVQDVDLTDLIRTAVALNESLAVARGIGLEVVAAKNLMLRGDPELLLQAVENLVNNALKYTPCGGHVVCLAMAGDDGLFEVRVVDEGPGLTDADLARAFRPFTRLSAVSDTPMAATGLGLWIVRLIAENHGGRIEAANNVGGPGATFRLCLPRANG
jgi:two-component system, OmpR family, sensor histidine kinase SenX3